MHGGANEKWRSGRSKSGNYKHGRILLTASRFIQSQRQDSGPPEGTP